MVAPLSIDIPVVDEVDDDRRLRWATGLAYLAAAAMAFSGSLKEVPPFSWSPLDLTLVTTVLAFGLALLPSLRRGTVPVGRPLAVFLLLFALAAVGSLNYVGTDYGFQKFSRFFIVTLPAAATVFLLVRDHLDFRRLVNTMLVLAVVQSVWINVGGARQFGFGRLVTADGTTISFGRAAGFVVVAAVAWALTSGSVTPRRLAVVAVVAGFHVWTTFAIASRGPIAGVVIGVLAVMGLQARRLRMRQGLRLLGLIAVLVGVISFVWSRIPADSRQRVFDLEDGSADARTSAWSFTWDHLSAAPLGRGWGSWDVLSPYPIGYPHNIFLEVWFEAGVIGLLALLLAVWIPVRHQDRVFAVDRFSGTLGFATLVYWLTTAQVSGEVNDNKVLIMLLVAAAAPLASVIDSDDSDGTDADGAPRRIAIS